MNRDMGRINRIFKRLGTALAFSALAALAAPAAADWGSPRLASVEVYDRFDGTSLPVYDHDGQRFIVGTPGHEYTLRIRNLSGERILAVTSVDGVNVVSGETASPDQSGYVIDGYGSVEITGWRKSLQRTAAFYFTDLGDSYAARTGRPGNVGVIGVAVFRERPRPIVYRGPREKIAGADAAGRLAENAQSAPSAGAPSAVEPAPPPMEARKDGDDLDAGDARRSESIARSMQSPLGTGHGRNESSYAARVNFERATSAPTEMLAVRYDRRETLAAMGVVPRDAYIARRAPEPFPAMRFVPDPR
jgi:hypothetical protein